MKLHHLVLREISHRKVNFLLAVGLVAMSVAALAWSNRLLRDHAVRAGAAEAALEAGTREKVDALSDKIRKEMKGLGFNVHIFPEGQQLSRVYEEGYATETMPEAYVMKLANSKIVTVNHLLPRLIRKLDWPEQKRTVICIGLRGEVPLAFKNPKKPLLDPVEPGTVVLGFELHRAAGVSEGDEIVFRDRTLKVVTCHAARGDADDITLWMNLGEVQTMLDLDGRINEILALECNCESEDRLGEIRRELAEILPGTKIIEKESKALARAEARVAVAAAGEEQLVALQAAHVSQQDERLRLFSVLLPLLGLLALAAIAYLSFSNVRERRSEIAILRAMGLGAGSVLGVVLGRALLAGVLGGVAGLLLGLGGEFPPAYWPLILLAAAGMAMAAAWLPALIAAREDPAIGLRYD